MTKFLKTLTVASIIAISVSACETTPKSDMPATEDIQSSAATETKDVSESEMKSDKKTLVRTFAVSESDAHSAILAALKLHGFTVKETDEGSIYAKRSNKVGLVAGSGGEKIYVGFDAIDAGNTAISVRTKKTFVGYAMQKNWNDEVMDAIAETLK